MLSFSILKVGLDEESALSYIRSQVPGHYITLSNINSINGKLKEFYITCKFVSKVALKNYEKGGAVLELKCREEKQDFSILFVKNLAKQIDELIFHGKISHGDFIMLKNPSIVVLYVKSHIQSLQIEIGQVENQSVIVWKSTSLFYIEPFLMQLTHVRNYKRIIFYELDHVGSPEHVLSNMCYLVSPHGPVKPLCEIAGSNTKSVALATFTKRVTPLNISSIADEDTYVQIKLNEILLESKLHISTMFIAFFFSELAKEIEEAVSTKLIEPGDLLALICPLFKSKTSAPININFPPHDQINLIVLKTQYHAREIGSELCQLNINHLYSNGCNVRKESSDADKEYSFIEFASIENIHNTENIILKIKDKLKLGKVCKLKDASKESFRRGLIIASFLKVIRPNGELEEDDKVTFYLREINVEFSYGAYFKLVLGQQFVKSFYSAVKKKNIVRGDIVCFFNPVVWENPLYIPTNYEQIVTYLVEIAIPKKQRIIVFKLRDISKDINLDANESKALEQDLSAVSVSNPNIKKSKHDVDVLYKQQSSDKNISNPIAYQQSNSGRQQSLQNKHKRIKIDNDNLFFEGKKTKDESDETDHSIDRYNRSLPKNEKEPNTFNPCKIAESQCDHKIMSAKVDCNTSHTSSKSVEHNKKNHTTTSHDEKYFQYQHKSIEKQRNQSSVYSKTESEDVSSKLQKSENNILVNKKLSQNHTLTKCDSHLYDIISNEFDECPIRLKNQNSIPEECFFQFKNEERQLQGSFSEYEQRFSVLPVLLTKPSIKQSLDMVSGFCVYGCKQMYPYSSIEHTQSDYSNSMCPRCSKVLKLDFCFELIAIGLGKLVTVLLQGPEAEKYVNITCQTFLNSNENCRERIVWRFKKELEHNKKFKNGKTIEATDTTHWKYVDTASHF